MASSRRWRFSFRSLSLASTALLGIVLLGHAATLAWTSTVIWRSAQEVDHDTYFLDEIRELDRLLRENHRLESIWLATPQPDLRKHRSELESGARELLGKLRARAAGDAERRALQQCETEIDRYLTARESVEASGVPLDQALRLLLPSFERVLTTLAALRVWSEKDRERSRARAEAALRNQRMVAVVSTLVLALGLSIVTAGVHRFVLRPIRDLRRSVQRFRAGDAGDRASGGALVETHELAERFNEMIDAITRQRRDQLTFLAAVAHDLRNPISGLKLSVQSAGREPGAVIPPWLARLERQLDRLDRMVGDLLDATRIESGHLELRFEEFDLSEVARSMVDLYAPPSSKHEVKLKAPEHPVIVHGDSLRVEQVVGNLVSNAIKYSPDGGPVEVEVAATGHDAVLSVSDRGIGIPPEDLPDLFLPFHRRPATAERVPGVGLGLFIVWRIVRAHGGQVEVQSEPGAGSTFRVRLPLGPPASGGPSSTPAPGTPTGG